MLSAVRPFRAIALYLSLSLYVAGQASDSVQAPDIVYSETSVEWPAPVPDRSLLLTVSGPAGLYERQEQLAGGWGRFALTNQQGQMRPDGMYKWELIVQAGWEGASQVQSGWFEIKRGRVVAQGTADLQPGVIEENAPGNSIYVDNQGRLGVGTSVPGAQLHVKGAGAGLAIEDTQTGGREYRLRSQESGDGSLGLFDQTTGKAGWLVDAQGRVGINTTKPTSTLTVDGYIETTRGFLVDGRPIGGGGLGLYGSSQPLSVEGLSNNFFGTGAGASNSGTCNSFFGATAGNKNTTGSYNSFFGRAAGLENTIGASNCFFGDEAGESNTTASYNSFFGRAAGALNTTGANNSFFGGDAGLMNTTGSDNSFFGRAAGTSNSTGFSNSFFGRLAGLANSTGFSNSFFGFGAGDSNGTGYVNSFFGDSAGSSNTSGYGNAFFGYYSGNGNTTGRSNSFFGNYSGWHNTVEHRNTFVGNSADLDPGANPAANPVTNATAIGAHAYVSQSNSLVLGGIAGVNGANSYVNVGIGISAPARQLHLRGPNAVFRMDRSANTAAFILCRVDGSGDIWKSFVVGTDAYDVNNGEFIIMDTGTGAGGVGTRRMTIENDGDAVFSGNVYAPNFIPTSSIAFKTNVRTLAQATDLVNRLRGVRFDWKSTGQPSLGLIAEEVDQVIPEVVSHNDKDGTARGVNYSSLVAVLVEAVKEQQATIEEEQKLNQEQHKAVESLRAEVEKLKALIERR